MIGKVIHSGSLPGKSLESGDDYQSGSKRYCWQTPSAPERSAGAGNDTTGLRAERAPDRDWSCCEFWSGVPAGTRTNFFDLSRWLRFAPPPATFRRPSGAEKRHLKTRANRRVLRINKNTGCHRPQSPAAVIESRVPLVVLFLIRENLARVGRTLVRP